MIEYVSGLPEEKADIIDFINYVFSQSHRPHDFKSLFPRSYDDCAPYNMDADHYMVKEDGRIKALIACRTGHADFCGKRLQIGQIGNVSVHPYTRGSGYMKGLLRQVIEDARKKGTDFLMLGGQRQRYGYFGFEDVGYQWKFEINDHNIRHALADVDLTGFEAVELTEEADLDFAWELYQRRPFHMERSRENLPLILRNCNCTPMLLRYQGERIGYMMGKLQECVLTDEKYFPMVLKYIFTPLQPETISVIAAPFERERIDYLCNICENYSLGHIEQILVLNWVNFLQGLLQLKASFTALEDGEASFVIDGVGYRIRVRNNVPLVEQAEPAADAPRYTQREAQLFFFQLRTLLQPDQLYHNWLPLCMHLDTGDFF